MRSVQKIYARFSAELDDILLSYELMPLARERDHSRLGSNRAGREGAVVQAFDAWGRLVRSSVMTFACQPVIGLSGHYYGPAKFKSGGAMLAYLNANKASIQNFQYGEPSWHLQPSAIDAIQTLTLPNSTTLIAAIGASTISGPTGAAPSPLVELHKLRNYIAHKGPKAASALSAHIQSSGNFSVLEWLDSPSVGVPRFRVMIENLRFISRLALQ